VKNETSSEIILFRQDTARRDQGASAEWAAQLRIWLGMMAMVITCGLTAVAQQTNQPASWYQRSINVQACGYGIGLCDEQLLSPAEAAQVRTIRRRMNVQACGYGIGLCDEHLLSPAEAAQVRTIRHQENVQSCGYGIGLCDEQLLSPAEAAQVRTIQHQMNVQACGYGIGPCDEQLLSPAEAAQVRTIRHQMNAQAPGHGIGPRNQANLTPPDSVDVQSARRAWESFASPYLSPSNVGTPAPAQPLFDKQYDELLRALMTLAGAPVAENGSYYGEPNKNGVPKTVLVNGYARSDGTYVRGYYRSAPGTNP
jgi:hypothetical protein